MRLRPGRETRLGSDSGPNTSAIPEASPAETSSGRVAATLSSSTWVAVLIQPDHPFTVCYRNP